MATYFHVTPEIQPEGLQTLYLMNPSYVSYTDVAAAAPPAMVFLNSVNPMSLVQANQLATHHQQHQQQHFAGIPLQASAAAADAAAPPQYNLWTQTSNNTVDVASQFSPRRSLPMASPSQQALSLSLSPKNMPGPAAAQMSPARANEAKMTVMMAPSLSVTGSGNGIASLQSFLLGSKYLKAAQHLLDEVVSVGKGIKDDVEKGASSKNPMKSSNKDTDDARTGAAAEEDTSAKRGADLTTAERQELQIKKAKLVNMLDEVSNWFINARVRLWKPMVEKMYAEEFKDQQQNNTEENTSKSDANGSTTPKSGGQQESSPTVAGPFDSLKNMPGQTLATLQQSTLVNGSNHSDYYDHEAILQPSLKKARSNESLHGNPVPPSVNVEPKSDQVSNQDFLLKFMDRRQRVDNQGYPLIPGNSSHGGSYGTYPIGDLARFDAEPFGAPPGFSGNGVSLTLGLPHCDNLSLSAAQPSFLSNEGMQLGRRLEMSNEAGDYCSLNSNATVAHSSNAYDSIALQNRKRFAAQLLPDFVS